MIVPFLPFKITKISFVTLGALVLSPLLLCGCDTKNRVSATPNVILITIETLRADHVSYYGYHRKTTPFLDSLAEKGTVFSNAYSASSWTAPSMASIFTALYPCSHGVTHGRDDQTPGRDILSSHFQTLAEALQDTGYTTFGISTSPFVSRGHGFGQGFDHFVYLRGESVLVVNQAVSELNEQIQRSSKYFLFIHYFDPHEPYYAREPWITQYNPNKSAYQRWQGRRLQYARRHISHIQEDPEARQALVDLYDSEINYCDSHLRNLFETLSLENNSMIIITSDHGEQFLERGGLGHGQTLYEEVTRVPLVIKLPGDTPARKTVAQPVSNKDIFPTILDALGVDILAEVGGRSLLSYAINHADEQTEPVYLELDAHKIWKAMRSGSWKFMCKGPEQNECFLFDLHTDPGEKTDVYREHQDVAQRMQTEIEAWIDAHPPFTAPTRKLQESQIENLRALGYAR